MAQVIVKADGLTPLVRRSAKGSTDIRLAALSVLRDIAKNGHALTEAGEQLHWLARNLQDLSSQHLSL